MKMSWYQLAATVIGSTGLFSFLQYIIKRNDDKKGTISLILKELESIKNQLADLKQDQLRLQLMDMIHIHPEDHSDIMEIAQKYFVESKGNWYLSSIFNEWMQTQYIQKPVWFK